MKIAIIEDHPLMAESLKRSLEEIGATEAVNIYTTGQAFLSAMRHTSIDVILLDYHLPDTTGAAVCKAIRAFDTSVKILVLTGFEKPTLVSEMLESGCSGYLLKSFTDCTVLEEALRRIVSGEIYLDQNLPGLYAKQLDSYRNQLLTTMKLTSREVEILKEVVNGLSSKEISEKLFISRRTVENHRNSIMIKTSSKNLASLIKFAGENNLI